ncbi:hypothetical protein GALL_203770 [mine drainage metagenome]|uniref:DUF4194 domain-containing protein n=1 Tax=mine drainage metagenome TaxID=410659 RepID=A0A1J5RPU4_9ZZZZ
MSEYWTSLSEACDGVIMPEDFAAVAYRLMTDQCLYHADRGSRTAYGIVDRYEREYAKVLAPFGVHLKVNRIAMYAVALPVHPKTIPAGKAETLFALVLRGIYEDFARNGHITDAGEVHCGLVELTERYRLMTGEDLTGGKGLFDSLMRTSHRWGIARWLDENEMPIAPSDSDSAIAIRPAIIDILGETALRRLALWQQSNAAIDGTSVSPSSDTDREVTDEAS